MYKENSFFEEIYATTTNDGEQSWTVPNSCPSGSDYRIKVSTLSNSTYDYSEYFTINHYFVKVTQPTNDSVIIPRTYVTIEWEANIPNDGVDIYLYLNSTEIQSIWMARNNSGTFIWNVGTYLGNTPSPYYRIKIEDKWDSSIYGFSEYFNITNTKYLTILTPIEGSSYTQNTTMNLTWETDTPCETVYILLKKTNYGDVLLINFSAINNGNYSWLIPNDLPYSDEYYIFIDAFDYSCFDYSDYFTIGSPPNPESIGFNINYILIIISIISIAVIIKKIKLSTFKG
ncbi:hypothetical protein LCGC14_1075020 [marine sediment metagenome]|uniref:Yeast cell wall synthesis Kre9/Knh1-like N-terminal domain-containing protein n=1 Tax=marine sediment metagenome TaxID=412755 RepID=A0A0F9MGV7_9ZZZZ|nr:hypothetical protein [bacterium]